MEPPGGKFRESLHSSIAGRSDDLATLVFARLGEEVPEYRVLSRPQIAGRQIEADVRSLCRAVIEALTRSPDYDRRTAPDLMRSVARRCLDDGVDADSLRLALRVGFMTAVEFLGPYLSDIGSDADSTAVSSLFADLIAYHDDLVTVIADLQIQARLRAPTKDRRLQVAIDDLLDGHFYSDSAICRRAADAGYDLHGAHGLALLSLPDVVDHPQHLRAAAVPLTKALATECAYVYRQSDHASHVAVLVPAHLYPAVSTAAHQHAGPAGLLILLVPPLEGPRYLHSVYSQLTALLPFVQRLLPACVVHQRDLSLYSLLAVTPADSAARYSASILRGVLNEGGTRTALLVKTLSVYYAASSKRMTARLLRISDRALDYRLARIAQLTGLHPAAHRATLELALRLLPLSAPHLKSEAVPLSRLHDDAVLPSRAAPFPPFSL